VSYRERAATRAKKIAADEDCRRDNRPEEHKPGEVPKGIDHARVTMTTFFLEGEAPAEPFPRDRKAGSAGASPSSD
jgi:hypothetical protein